MTNPDNKLGVNAAFQGRTAPNTFNAVLQALTGRGVLCGFEVTPSSGLTVTIGGNGSVPDVAVVQDDISNRLVMVNRTTLPITQTLSAAPDSGSRIDAIVVYTDNPPEVLEDLPTVDNPTVCAMLVVEGVPDATPTAPNDTAIRAAITTDGASGTTAYYAVLAYITVENGVTDITAGEIEDGPSIFANAGLVGGSNVTIGADGRTISATDTTYTAGSGLNLAGTTFSADTSVLATQTDLTEKAIGETETYTIPTTSWGALTGASPFTYHATVTATYTLGNNTQAELINDQAVIFANLGFAIGAISGQTLDIYALDIPTSSVDLKVSFKEVS